MLQTNPRFRTILALSPLSAYDASDAGSSKNVGFRALGFALRHLSPEAARNGAMVVGSGKREPKGWGGQKELGEGTWRFRVTIGGKPFDRYVHGLADEDEATRERIAWVSSLRADRSAGSATLGSLIRRYMAGEQTKNGTLSENTRRSYENELKKLRALDLGLFSLKIDRTIDAEWASDLFARLRKARNVDIVARNQTEVMFPADRLKKVYDLLAGAFRVAVSDRILAVSPITKALLAPPPGERRAVKHNADAIDGILEPETVQCLMSYVRNPFWRLVFDILIETGIRPGECAAIRWSDFKLANGEIRLSVGPSRVNTNDPAIAINAYGKTSKSHRRLVLSPGLWSMALAHKRQQIALYESLNLPLPEFVLWNEAKRMPYQPNAISQAFDRYWKDMVAEERAKAQTLGLDYEAPERFGRGPYNFRHFAATMMLASGEPMEVVSKRLGHESVAFTSKQYGHLETKSDARLAQVMASLPHRTDPLSVPEKTVDKGGRKKADAPTAPVNASVLARRARDARRLEKNREAMNKRQRERRAARKVVSPEYMATARAKAQAKASA